MIHQRFVREPFETDSFFRERVSNPTTQFAGIVRYNTLPLKFEKKVVGTGNVIVDPQADWAIISVGGNAGDKTIWQTKRYIPYNGANSQLPGSSFVMDPPKPGLRIRLGPFDAENGYFLERTASSVRLASRSIKNVTAENPEGNVYYEQADWNRDRLDGSGGKFNRTKVTLDLAKVNRINIDYQFSGRVRFFFNVAGKSTLVHTVTASNTEALPLIASPTLPLRFEIENLAATGSPSKLISIVPSVLSEGGPDNTIRQGYPSAASRGITAVTVGTTFVPLLSIRPKTNFGGKINRGLILLEGFTVLSDLRPLEIALILNGTLSGPVTWQDADNANSMLQYDIAATGITGGSRHLLDYAETDLPQMIPADLLEILTLSNNIDGNQTDMLTIMGRVTTGSSSVLAAVRCKEIY